MRTISNAVAATATALLLSCSGGDSAGPGFTLGGTIAGLSGSGLVLQNNGASPLTVSASAATFTFSASLTSGASYNVSIRTHPTGPSQSCAVANAAGTITASITTVAVSCTTNTYTVGGFINGLAGSGLELRLNGETALTLVPGFAAYAFPALLSGTSYTVTIATQPSNPAQTCTIVNATGTVGAANRTTIAVTCVSIPPTMTLSITPAKVTVGQSATLTWTSTNATTCTAADAWSGAKSVGGTATITPSAGGRPAYSLACSGAGGTANQSVTLVVPMQVFPSSYENAKKIVLDNPNVPTHSQIRQTDPLAWGGGPMPNFWIGTVTFADFFQEGTYSAVISIVYNDPVLHYYIVPSTTYFIRKNASGNWVDATIGKLSDKTGCVHPRKSFVADFNADGRPDVFFACQGTDAPPWPGERQRILLSQADGTYSNTQLPFSGFGHGGAAGDLDGDNRPDVIVTSGDAPGGSRPYVLLNNGDGSFRQDFTRTANLVQKAIFTAELIDLRGTGRYDLLIGGHQADATGTTYGPNTFPNGFFANDGNGHFLTQPYVSFPNPLGGAGKRYSLALDFIFLDGFVYMLQVDRDYAGVAVQKVKLSDLSVTTLYEHNGPYIDECKWFGWIYPTADGRIVPAQETVTMPVNPLSCHAVSIPR